jgi:hypothetical protein
MRYQLEGKTSRQQIPSQLVHFELEWNGAWGLNGQVAAALMENAGKLFDDPAIEMMDVIAAKLPR